MAANIKGITIKIDGDATPLQKALEGLNKSIKKTSGELRDVNKLLKFDPKNTELLRQKQGLLSKKVDDVREKLKLEQKALAQLKEKDQTDAVREQMAQLERQIIDDELALKSAEKALKSFGSVGTQQVKAVSEQLKKTGQKITEVGESVQGVGNTLTTHVTAPIVAVGSASVAMASTFEDAMAKVSTIADETVVPLEELEKQILELSDETGISAAELAENVYNAISAGQDTADAVAFVANATKLARAGFTESGAALDILTTILNAYGLEAEEVTRVSDVLINTQNLGKTTVGELASAMGKVIPTAKSQGVELEQLASAYAVMTSNGIATAETTTYLNSMLNELGKEGTTAETAFRAGTESIKEGGLSMAEAMAQGWTLTDVLAVLQKQADESGTTIANMFGSAEAGKAANVLADNTDKYNESLVAMQNSAGETDEAFSKLDTSSYKAQKALNELKNSAVEVGTTILEMLAPAIDKAKQVIEDLKAKWESLSPEAQKTIVTVAGIVAVVGPVIAAIGTLIIFIGNIVTAVGVVAGVLTGIGPIALAVVAAIAIIGAKIAWLVAHWDELTAKVKEVWGKVVEYCKNLKDDVAEKWEELKAGISQKVQNIKTDLMNKWNSIKSDAVNKVTTMKNDVVNKIIELKNNAIQKVNDIKDKFAEKFDWIKDKVKGVVDSIKGFFDGLELKLPEIKLPKLPTISLKTNTKTILGKEITYPSGFDINWNAKAMKAPYMFTNPTVMQTPYGAVGAGEAGHEIMYGHSSLMQDISAAVSAGNAGLVDSMYTAFSAALTHMNFSVNIGRREFARVVKEATL